MAASTYSQPSSILPENLTSEQIAILNRPQDVRLYERLGNPVAIILDRHGDTRAAQRLENCGRFFRYAKDHCGVWRENASRCMLTRACTYCAEHYMRKQLKRYSMLESISPARFTTLSIEIPLTSRAANVYDGIIGRLASLHPNPILSRIGQAKPATLSIKLILLAELDYKEIAVIEQTLGRKVMYKTHAKAEFHNRLIWVLTPHLPVDDQERAEFALAFQGKEKTVRFTGMTRQQRQETFVYRATHTDALYNYNNTQLLKGVPHCPKCSGPAEFVSPWLRNNSQACHLDWIPTGIRPHI